MEGISFIPLIILMVVLMALIFLNVPVAFSLAFSAILVGSIYMSPSIILQGVLIALNKMQSFVLLAVPLFVYMGVQLRYSGEAEILYGGIYKLAGGFRGSLAITTIITGALIAAMSGISGAGTVALGLMALPIMEQYKYDKKLGIGAVSAAGALGTLIPPSVVMILYGEMSSVSVAKLYAGGVLPGLVLAAICIVYIIIITRLRPETAPPFTMKVPTKEKVKLAANILPALVLIVAVMISIYTGLATPTEAAVVGALGAIIIAACRRKMTLKVLKVSVRETFRMTAMVMFLLIGGGLFSIVFVFLGGIEMVRTWFGGMGGDNFWLPLIITQLVLIGLGCFLDIASIIIITVPIFVPILSAMGVDPLWFGVLFTVNMEMAYKTPPFGMNLFYMRAITPPSVTMGDIYWSMVPYIVCQFIALVLTMIFPALALWLPSLL